MRHKFMKTLLMILIAVVFFYALWQVARYIIDLVDSEQKYDDLRSAFTSETDESASESSNAPQTHESTDGRIYEDAEPPLTIDWEGLRAQNPDIVGWIYVDGQPGISYPVVQGDSNDTYLHTSYLHETLYAGSIFLNADNADDLSDAVSIIYGHNMRNGSMFGMLKFMMDQNAYDNNPYFWILTPQGDYRYHIFSAFTTEDGSEAFTIHKAAGKEFAAWADRMKQLSVISTNKEAGEGDKVVVLSTCKGAGTDMRNLVMGVLCSTARPKDHNYAEENVKKTFNDLAATAFPETDTTSYILTAPGTDISIATRGQTNTTVVRDTWSDVYTVQDNILIHYEMLTGNAETSAEMTDGAWRWDDPNYDDVKNGTLHKERLVNGLQMLYRTNSYKVGEATYCRETFGIVDMGQAYLRITVTELRNVPSAFTSGTGLLGKLVTAIEWPQNIATAN